MKTPKTISEIENQLRINLEAYTRIDLTRKDDDEGVEIVIENLHKQITSLLDELEMEKKEVLEYPETNGGDYEKGWNACIKQLNSKLKSLKR